MKIQQTELTQALTQHAYQNRIINIINSIKCIDGLFKPLEINIDLIHFNKLAMLCDELKSTTDSVLMQQITKSFWVIDTFQQIKPNHKSKHEYYGELLFECVDVFDLSPLEEINLKWSTIFSLMAIDRLFQLKTALTESVSLESALDGYTTDGITALHIDAIDCASKALTFHKLVDEGWVKSYQAKLNRKKQTDKLIPLQQIVLIKYIKQHSDTNVQSAANAIEAELLAESHQALDVLKSKTRLSKTFAEWISNHLSGELKVPIF